MNYKMKISCTLFIMITAFSLVTIGLVAIASGHHTLGGSLIFSAALPGAFVAKQLLYVERTHFPKTHQT